MHFVEVLSIVPMCGISPRASKIEGLFIAGMFAIGLELAVADQDTQAQHLDIIDRVVHMEQPLPVSLSEETQT